MRRDEASKARPLLETYGRDGRAGFWLWRAGRSGSANAARLRPSPAAAPSPYPLSLLGGEGRVRGAEVRFDIAATEGGDDLVHQYWVHGRRHGGAADFLCGCLRRAGDFAPSCQGERLRAFHLQRAVQYLAEAQRDWSIHDDHRDGSRPLSVRRRALVQYRLWPRRHHHGPGVSLAQSGARAWRPGLPGCNSSQGGHSGEGRRARKNPARNPRRRDGCPSAKFPSAATTVAWDAFTPLFVLLAGAYYERTGDRPFIESIWPNIELALSWIDTYGDS